ncbi:MAG: diaminopimelate epimerase [Hyphomicrobiaceae bacterium]|nr:diaminopimelate epimerase [Hyphomicrobiaceae bacterium]
MSNTPTTIEAPAGVTLDLVKMNGLGNEIVVADLRASRHVLTAAEVRAIAAAPGWSFDQLMVLHAPRTSGTDAYVRIYNADGSEAGACGNGMRCVGLIVAEETGRRDQRYETAAGSLEVKVASAERIAVDMGRPRFRWDEIPLSEPFHDTRRIELQVGPIDAPVLHSPSAVSMGNPHVVFWVDDVDAHDLARHGSLLEHHPLFPERANISLAQMTSRSSIRLRTWERGAGLTRACGSAACAAAVAAARKGLTGRKVTVTLPGGPLEIEWRGDDRVVMTGPAEIEHRGRLTLAPAAASA